MVTIGSFKSNSIVKALIAAFSASTGHDHDGTNSKKVAVGSLALADGKILVGNASGAAAPVTPAGDVTISNAGATAIAAGVIVNADVKADAAIAYSKMKAPFFSAEQTGTGSEQDIAHSLGATPTVVIAIPSNLTGGAFVVSYGTHDGTNCKVTVTTGEKYKVLALA